MELENHMVMHLNEHLDTYFGEETRSDEELLNLEIDGIRDNEMDGDLVFETITEGCKEFDIQLIDAIIAGDECEVGRLIVDQHKYYIEKMAADRLQGRSMKYTGEAA